MKEPKVTIKNLKSFRGMEGLGFNADVYVNGVKVMFAMDGGDGGQCDYEIVKGQEANVQLIKDYVKSISKRGDDSDIELDMYIAGKVDEYENQKLIARNEKKMKALYSHALVIGKPNDNKYKIMDFKQSLSKIGKTRLQFYLSKLIHDECHDGVEILNTNLVDLGMLVK